MGAVEQNLMKYQLLSSVWIPGLFNQIKKMLHFEAEKRPTSMEVLRQIILIEQEKKRREIPSEPVVSSHKPPKKKKKAGRVSHHQSPIDQSKNPSSSSGKGKRLRPTADSNDNASSSNLRDHQQRHHSSTVPNLIVKSVTKCFLVIRNMSVHFAKKNYSPDQATVEDAGTVIKVVVLCGKCAAVKSLIISE